MDNIDDVMEQTSWSSERRVIYHANETVKRMVLVRLSTKEFSFLLGAFCSIRGVARGPQKPYAPNLDDEK